MQKSLREFVSLPEAEQVRMIERGPVLLTQNEEPKFVAQPIDQFEAMVRRLRELESAAARQPRHLAIVIPLRP